ncbi:glycosyltransferase [Glycomyces luteolus]|uniref:Glycosyltransferase n=1 Tax=Glycomyces luteolus TaxID=2670330 RepID=A0A9X3PBQ1_9ACTN|nr:glycosyltransferase [Glycomyces luteolus]MDA1361141.1 glycosyltransferase [Glycomyces luteolus]
MRLDDMPNVQEMVDRALGSVASSRIKDIHEWGQFHNSRLVLHVLSRLAYPADPELMLDLRGHEPRVEKAALNLEALCALAASIGLKARTGDERAKALALFDLAYRRLRGRMPLEYQELHVMTAHLHGRSRQVKELSRAYAGVTDLLKRSLRCQAAHPRHGGSTAAYLRRFKELADWPDLLAPENGAALSIDGLRTAPLPKIERGPLISVVMTCYKPGQALLTAVRSIVEQTWQNWELLLVDDASGPEYEQVLLKAASLDPRIKLLIQPENAGTYQARNRAMAVAEGKFIAGLDSDDWSHPRRLELQVRPMIARPELVMVESRCIALAEDLALMIDPQIALIAARSTPIMIRAEAVLKKVGFYDEVRKTADSEYRFRIQTAFGKGAFLRMGNGPLTAVRYNDSTLSAGEVSRHWMSASRFAYYSGFARWHRAIGREQASPFLASVARPRPFPIARDITRSNAENRAIEYDRIYAADWSALDGPRRAMLDDAEDRADEGAAIALVHCPDLKGIKGDQALVDRTVLTAASEHGLDFIEPAGPHTAPVITPSEAYAEVLRFEHPGIAPERIHVHPAPATAAAQGAVANGATVQAPVDPPVIGAQRSADRPVSPQEASAALRPAFNRSDFLLAGCGLGSVAASVAVAAAIEPAVVPWVAGASFALWAGSLFALAAWRTFESQTAVVRDAGADPAAPAVRPAAPDAGGNSPAKLLRRFVKAAVQRRTWTAAAIAPLVPALGAFAPDPRLAVGIALTVLCLLAATTHSRLLRALDRTRMTAAAPDRGAPTGTGLTAPKRRMLESWETRLNHGWSVTAGARLSSIAADSEKGPRETQVGALAALCSHRAARNRHRARTLRADIVIVSTFNLRGGTTSANEAEILAYLSAGLTVALVHHPVKERAMGRPIDPKIRALIDGERVVEVRPQDTVHCDLAIVRFPVALEQLMEDRPEIKAARTVLLVNQTPFEEYGPTGGYGTAWSIADVHRNVTEWLGHHTWYAIGPAVRDVLHAHHAEEMADIELAQDFWYETIDVADWTPPQRRIRAEGEPIRLGRHSRDHVTKFPNMAKRLLAAYPAADDIEIHMLGGHDALQRILGSIPPRWISLPFGTMSAVDFLADVDVYAYYIDENLLEAFGRAPMEAMAAGLPTILPPNFAELFGDGAVYCEPEDVAAEVRRLAADRAYYAERVEAGLRVVRERFSPEALLRRVSGLGVTTAAPAAEPNLGGTR